MKSTIKFQRAPRNSTEKEWIHGLFQVALILSSGQLYDSKKLPAPSPEQELQGERGIVEVKFPFTGDYMFHAHKTEFAERGWMGFFRVIGKDGSKEASHHLIGQQWYQHYVSWHHGEYLRWCHDT